MLFHSKLLLAIVSLWAICNAQLYHHNATSHPLTIASDVNLNRGMATDIFTGLGNLGGIFHKIHSLIETPGVMNGADTDRNYWPSATLQPKPEVHDRTVRKVFLCQQLENGSPIIKIYQDELEATHVPDWPLQEASYDRQYPKRFWDTLGWQVHQNDCNTAWEKLEMPILAYNEPFNWTEYNKRWPKANRTAGRILWSLLRKHQPGAIRAIYIPGTNAAKNILCDVIVHPFMKENNFRQCLLTDEPE